MKPASQSEKAYKSLRNQLIARNIDPGARLTEQAWAKSLTVNRGDVRQALARLLAEGLVSRGDKGGYFARDYSKEDFQQINEARLILETAAARLAVQRATPQDLHDLQEITEHMTMMAQNGYSLGLAEADIRFHETLVKAAHNDKLLAVYQLANIPLSGSSMSIAPDEAHHQKMLRDARNHRQMVEALRLKDIQQLIQLLEMGLQPHTTGSVCTQHTST